MDFISVSLSLGSLEAAIALNNRPKIDGSYYIIYKECNPGIIRVLTGGRIVPINEISLFDYISYDAVRTMLRTELRHRTGWYFQQFLQIAAGLFLSHSQEMILAGSDFLMTDSFRAKTARNKKYLSIIPHAKRNWDTVHEKLGVFGHNKRHCFVVEHVVTDKRILEFIVRHYSFGQPTLTKAFHQFVAAVISVVNASYSDILSNYANTGSDIPARDPAMIQDLFSEYQFVSLMTMNNFGHEVALRNISHLRYRDHVVNDRKMKERYAVIVFEG